MKHVTVATDSSRSSRAAVAHGVDLARALRVGLRLVHLDNTSEEAARFSAQVASVEHGMPIAPARLDEDAERASSMVQALAADLARTSIALVIATDRRETLMDRLGLSLLGQLMQIAPVPVLIVGPDTPRMPQDEGLALVPIDFDEAALSVLPETLELCNRLSAQPRLLHVVSPYDHSELDHEAMMHRMGRVLALPGQTAATIVRHGDPGRWICDEARELGASVVVMHGHDHTGLRRVFRHGTTQWVVHHTDKPVMILPPVVQRPRAA